jgi:hypothetical protein
MKDRIDTFVELERAISDEKGSFWLFALFLREDAQDRWDLVLSASWTQGNVKEALQYVAGKVQEVFGPSELAELSRIVIVDKDNPLLDAANRATRTEHRVAEVTDRDFVGLPIKHAYIITSLSPGDAVPAA